MTPQIGDHVKHTDPGRHLELGPGEVKDRWTNYCECKRCYARVGANQKQCHDCLTWLNPVNGFRQIREIPANDVFEVLFKHGTECINQVWLEKVESKVVQFRV